MLLAVLLPGAQAVGDRNFLGHLAYSIAFVFIDSGETEDTASWLKDSLVAFQEIGNKACAAHTLDQVARWAVATERPETAAQLLAATSSLRERLGIQGHPMEARFWAECHEQLRESLDEEPFTRAWETGRMLDYAATMKLGLLSLADR